MAGTAAERWSANDYGPGDAPSIDDMIRATGCGGYRLPSVGEQADLHYTIALYWPDLGPWASESVPPELEP